MTDVITRPHIITAVAADIEEIGSAISAANAAAAGPTSALLAPAAADEISAVVTKLFGAYGSAYQAVVTQATRFHNGFARALAAAGNAYANAESANAAALAATSAVTPINSDLTLVLGGTGNPTPNTTYVTNANNLYIRASNLPRALFTPEEGFPITGVQSLTFDRSIGVGLTVMSEAIDHLPSGGTLTIFGYSQSAIISSLEMQRLAALGPAAPAPNQLTFVLVGNEMNPNGGLLARFPNLSIPSLGLTFYGATPADTPYTTNIYTLEYDGFADFPRYPMNFLSDLNAAAGILFVHTTYMDLTPGQVDHAIPLDTSPGYHGNTHYYMIPTEHLPLLTPVRGVPVIGAPIADLLEPDLRVLVNLGYGDPAYGYSTAPADVPTTFGLAPHVPASTVLAALAAGTQQGIHDFVTDIPAALTTPPVLPEFKPPPLIADLMGPPPPSVPPTPGNIVNTVAAILSNDYGVRLPTRDIAISLFTTMPAYDASLFASQLAEGNLINAIGYPIAADVGLASVAGLIEFIAVAEAAIFDIRAIQSLLP
jgi:hypothetical protein